MVFRRMGMNQLHGGEPMAIPCRTCGGEKVRQAKRPAGINTAGCDLVEVPCPDCRDGVAQCEFCEQRDAVIVYYGRPTCAVCMQDGPVHG